MIRFAGLYPTESALDRGRDLLTQFVTFLDSDTASKVSIVFAEAMANAIQANQRNNGARIIIILVLGVTTVRLLIGDTGSGYEPQLLQDSVFDLWAEHGRGIRLMRQLSDDLVFKKSKRGTMVSASWKRKE